MKIKLVTNDNHELNFSKCFYNCSSLLEFYEIAQNEPEIESNSNEKENDSNKNINNIKNLENSFSASLSMFDNYQIQNDKNLNENQFYFEISKSLQLSEISEVSNAINIERSLSNIKSLIPGQMNNRHIYNLSYMFCGCNSLKLLIGLYDWNIKNAIDMQHMFHDCASLNTLPDISKWDTTNIKYLNDIFCGCTSLKNIPDISSWRPKKIIDM